MSEFVGAIVEARGGSQDDYSEIAEVIHAETRAFQIEDFEAWQTCWVHDERTQDVCISVTAGISVLNGWRGVAANTEKAFGEDISCKVLEFGQKNCASP